MDKKIFMQIKNLVCCFYYDIDVFVKHMFFWPHGVQLIPRIGVFIIEC